MVQFCNYKREFFNLCLMVVSVSRLRLILLMGKNISNLFRIFGGKMLEIPDSVDGSILFQMCLYGQVGWAGRQADRHSCSVKYELAHLDL